MTSAIKEIMFAVSRTVSPWAIWLLPSSKSCTSRPSRLQAEAKEKRVRVELSRKRLIPRPESNILVEMLFSRRQRSASATVKRAASSSSLLSHVRKKSSPYIREKSSPASVSAYFCIRLISSAPPHNSSALPQAPPRSVPSPASMLSRSARVPDFPRRGRSPRRECRSDLGWTRRWWRTSTCR